MLDQQKISMGRVREAYALNGNEVEKVIQALWPDNVFPVELWHRTHEVYWRAFADSNQATYGMKSPALPEIKLSNKRFHTYLCSLDILDFFKNLSANIPVNALREGLKYIMEETYEDIDVAFPEERNFLFSTLMRLNTVDIFDQYSPNSELFEEKILSIPASGYHFISHIFPDTVLVDKVAAIRYLRYYPLVREVKGITHALVHSIISSMPEEAPDAIIPPSQPQEQAMALPSTGSRKDIKRINATRQVSEDLVKELLQEKHVFESDKDSWKQSLLFDNGKTNWKTFKKAVEVHLGSKPHHDAARAEWDKVPDGLKHNGRVREQ